MSVIKVTNNNDLNTDPCENLLIHSLIHSGHFYSAPSSPLLLLGAPDYSTDTVSEFHAEAPQATAGKGLAQGPYMAARVGVEPTSLRLKVIVSTKAPPRPKNVYVGCLVLNTG